MVSQSTSERKTTNRKRSYGSGRVYKPAGCRFWYIQYYADKKQIRESAHTVVKTEAEALLRNRMVGRDRGEVSPMTQKKITFGRLREGLLKAYHEQGNKSLQVLSDGSTTIWGLKALDTFFHYKSPAEPGDSVVHITTARARKFADDREAAGIGAAAINRSMALLRRMLNLAKREKLINDVPWIPMREEPAARKGFLPREKFDDLLAALPKHLRPLVTFLYWTGVRLGEALQIQWTQVDLNAALVVLEAEQTKNSEARTIPLPDVLLVVLQKVKVKQGQVFDATNLRRSWMKACAEVGLGRIIEVPGKPYDPRYVGLIVHDLRRSAIRNLIDAGVSEPVAMAISGHKTASVFKRYAIVDKTDVLKAMRRVQENGHSLPPADDKSEALPEAPKRLGA